MKSVASKITVGFTVIILMVLLLVILNFVFVKRAENIAEKTCLFNRTILDLAYTLENIAVAIEKGDEAKAQSDLEVLKKDINTHSKYKNDFPEEIAKDIENQIAFLNQIRSAVEENSKNIRTLLKKIQNN